MRAVRKHLFGEEKNLRRQCEKSALRLSNNNNPITLYNRTGQLWTLDGRLTTRAARDTVVPQRCLTSNPKCRRKAGGNQAEKHNEDVCGTTCKFIPDLAKE